MTYYRLKLPNAAHLDAAYDVEWDRDMYYADDHTFIVRLGTLHEPGTYDENGEELTPPTPLEGWHADIVTDNLPEVLEQYIVHPENPKHDIPQ